MPPTLVFFHRTMQALLLGGGILISIKITSSTALIFPTTSIAINNPLPPSARLILPGGARSLRIDCDAYVNKKNQESGRSIWADDVGEGYEVAARVFDTILKSTTCTSKIQKAAATNVTVWFPKLNDVSMMTDLVNVITDNSIRLGGWTASVEAWPEAPATGISLQVLPSSTTEYRRPQYSSPIWNIDKAILTTEAWVDGTLGRLGLCPYTTSLSRAAVGLDSVGVEEGPVVVRHASSWDVLGMEGDDDVRPAPDAAILAASFWEGVMDLATKPEEEVATFLIVAPTSYDDDFPEFLSTCDDLLEQSAKAVGADVVIGKAWFHPLYDSHVVGQDKILPGHALPAQMVKEFVDTYYGDDTQIQQQLDVDAVAKANDAVRHTPHATVNLLRRSQLRASKEAEAAAGAKKPNSIYARNVVRLTSEIQNKS